MMHNYALNPPSPPTEKTQKSKKAKKQRAGVRVLLSLCGFPVGFPFVPLALICSSPGGRVG